MADTRYFTVAEVVEFHHIIMERTGYYSAPLRDAGALESAIMRPQMASHYEGADLIRQTALLMIGISQAQAFADGNKRTAFFVGDLFLRYNGFEPQTDPLEIAKQLEAVAEREDSLEVATSRFEAWLREHVVPR